MLKIIKERKSIFFFKSRIHKMLSMTMIYNDLRLRNRVYRN